MRARQRYLGLLPDERPTYDEDLIPFEGVAFTREARHFLRRQLSISGRLRGGLLFGAQKGKTLEVMLASSMGYPWWYADQQQTPLHLDERYILGWSDCVEALHGGRVDWVGNWLAYPNSTLDDECEDLTWLDLGTKHGLFDDRHVLVVVGWVDGSLTGRAYRYDFGERVYLNCSLRTVLPPTVHNEAP